MSMKNQLENEWGIERPKRKPRRRKKKQILRELYMGLEALSRVGE
jgi:hypothetical protein